jgi:PAS domain S-box-containing protein
VVAQVKALLRARQAEAERDRLLTRLRLNVEQMPLACLNLDADLHNTDWNHAAEEIFGFRRDEVLGRNAYDLLVPAAARVQVQEVNRRLRAGDMNAHSVNENVTRDGRTILCEWVNTRRGLTGGKPSGSLRSMRGPATCW